MKKRFLSLVVSFFCVCSSLIGVGCQGTGTGTSATTKTPPEYTQNSEQKFVFWSYAPTDGIYRQNGEEFYSGEDFRTEEQYQMYKDVGFNMLHLSSTVRADNVSSKAEYDANNLAALAAANNVGFDQIIISDWRIAAVLSKTTGGLIGRDKMFPNEAALDAYIAECISYYKDIEGVNAFNVGDEPRMDQLEAFGQVYQSIGRVWPEAYRFYNFFGGIENEEAFGRIVPREGQSRWDAAKELYEEYIYTAIDCMGGDIPYLSFDRYPLIASGVHVEYFPTLEILAKICKQKGMELYAWTQSCEMYSGSTLIYRKVNRTDVQWMNNSLLGFGVSGIGCFTYSTTDWTNGEIFADGGSLLTYDHEKTEIYDYYQEICARNQDFASVILNFDYRGCRTYSVSNSPIDVGHVKGVDNTHVFKAISDVSIDKGCALVTELYDTKTRNSMYMIMNAIDTQVKGSKAYQTTTVTFDNQYSHVLVFKNAINEPYTVELKNHKLEIEQTPGEAVYVIPY